MLEAAAGVCGMSQFNVLLVQEILTVSCHVSMLSKGLLNYQRLFVPSSGS